MRNPYFLIFTTIILLLLFFPIVLYGHTINQHLEELYGEVYLPFFIARKWLPFVGLGMLAYNPVSRQKGLQVKWVFLVALMAGTMLGLFISGSEFTLMANNVGVLLCGFVLLFSGYNTHLRITSIFILMGTTIGIENGSYIRHSDEFVWLFILIFIIGLVLFIILNNIQFIGHPNRKIVRYASSIILVLSGLLLILLA